MLEYFFLYRNSPKASATWFALRFYTISDSTSSIQGMALQKLSAFFQNGSNQALAEGKIIIVLVSKIF